MDPTTFLISTTVFSLIVSLLFVFFLLTVESKNKISNALFATFILLTALDFSAPLFHLITSGPSNLGMFRNTSAFLQIPAFYLYILSVCYADFKLKPQHLFHLLPFIVVNLILLPRFYLAPVASKIDFILNRQDMIELQLNHVFFHVQIVIYVISVFVLLTKVKRLYLENYSGTSIKSYRWLLQFTSVLTALYFIVLFKNIFKFSDYPAIAAYITTVVFVFQLVLVCWYLIKALNNPHLFRNIDSKLQLVTEIILEKPKSIQLAQMEFNEALLKLKTYMVEEKPFLNPSLSMQDISDAIHIPVRDLSLLINHNLKQHFYDFINSYRVENAMVVLKDSSKSRLTILEILYQSGYNSKSSFNSAFKKHTGKTPTQYRKNL